MTLLSVNNPFTFAILVGRTAYPGWSDCDTNAPNPGSTAPRLIEKHINTLQHDVIPGPTGPQTPLFLGSVFL